MNEPQDQLHFYSRSTNQQKSTQISINQKAVRSESGREKIPAPRLETLVSAPFEPALIIRIFIGFCAPKIASKSLRCSCTLELETWSVHLLFASVYRSKADLLERQENFICTLTPSHFKPQKPFPHRSLPTQDSDPNHLLDLGQLVLAGAPVLTHVVPREIESELVAFKTFLRLA